ncbi:hypothetical protein HispidOSU_000884, partial [Sigmodon hispidus]
PFSGLSMFKPAIAQGELENLAISGDSKLRSGLLLKRSREIECVVVDKEEL